MDGELTVGDLKDFLIDFHRDTPVRLIYVGNPTKQDKIVGTSTFNFQGKTLPPYFDVDTGVALYYGQTGVHVDQPSTRNGYTTTSNYRIEINGDPGDLDVNELVSRLTETLRGGKTV